MQIISSPGGISAINISDNQPTVFFRLCSDGLYRRQLSDEGNLPGWSKEKVVNYLKSRYGN
jgi:hypothetical protein